MADVTITELRQNLHKFLARVHGGERLRVTSRGKPIAEISPPNPLDRAADARARLKGSVLRYDRPLDPVIAVNAHPRALKPLQSAW